VDDQANFPDAETQLQTCARQRGLSGGQSPCGTAGQLAEKNQNRLIVEAQESVGVHLPAEFTHIGCSRQRLPHA
jgi:hypothetical protein